MPCWLWLQRSLYDYSLCAHITSSQCIHRWKFSFWTIQISQNKFDRRRRPTGYLFYLGDPCRFPQAKLKPPPLVAASTTATTSSLCFNHLTMIKTELSLLHSLHHQRQGYAIPTEQILSPDGR